MHYVILKWSQETGKKAQCNKWQNYHSAKFEVITDFYAFCLDFYAVL
jgi:hypothetical protein